MVMPLRDCADKFLSFPQSAYAIFAASAFALLFAYVFQYGFGYEPCILCLWQRVPFVAAILLTGLSFAPPLRKYAPLLLGLCAVSFLACTVLAAFHTGVERHWWLGTEGCAITPLNGATPKDLRALLLGTPVAHCDEISWAFLGLSMANYNVPFSLALAGFAALAARRARV